MYSIIINASGQSITAAISRTVDSGYLLFQIREYTNPLVFHYSLFRINFDDFERIEQFFEGLKRVVDTVDYKPIIYLYPEVELNVSVQLAYEGQLTVTYPAYNDGWNVRAYPDGRLINLADGLEYSYLFWEGIPDDRDWWSLDEGYCIAGADTVSFLQKTLSGFGLTPREYNEFIVYWLPLMQDNPYNLISFQWEEYERRAPLIIDPAPDSVLRVFMVFVPLDKPIDIKAPAERTAFVRNGFTVVEWGGSKIEY